MIERLKITHIYQYNNLDMKMINKSQIQMLSAIKLFYVYKKKISSIEEFENNFVAPILYTKLV